MHLFRTTSHEGCHHQRKQRSPCSESDKTGRLEVAVGSTEISAVAAAQRWVCCIRGARPPDNTAGSNSRNTSEDRTQELSLSRWPHWNKYENTSPLSNHARSLQLRVQRNRDACAWQVQLLMSTGIIFGAEHSSAFVYSPSTCFWG